ncbi:MAG: 30S ribosomal protein S16, partial [Lysobacteraceae bacterium]
NPVAQGNEQRVQIDTDRIQHWVGVGAQMTEKVDQLYRDAVKAAAQAA